MTKPTEIEKPWSKDEQELVSSLGSSSAGLSFEEAQERLRKFGPNEIRGSYRTPFEIFLYQYKNPLILILIFTSLIYGVLGDWFEASIIILMVFINSLMGFLQEARSEKAVATLKKKISHWDLVIRDGKEVEVDASTLVVCDLVKLKSGDVIPADLRILESNNLLIDQSMITGESFPDEKLAVIIDSDNVTSQEAKNIAFMGTN